MKVTKGCSFILAILMVFMTATTVFAANWPSYSSVHYVNGFSIPFSLSITNSRTGRATLSCNGTTTQNPKPTTIYAGITLTVLGKNGQVYYGYGSDTGDYGESISIITTKSTASSTDLYRVTGNYSFLGDTWAYLYTLTN